MGFNMSDESALNPAARVYGWELRLDIAASGVKNAFPPTAKEIVLHGVSFTQPALLAEAQDVVAPWKAVREAKAVIRAFAQQKKALIARARKFLGELQTGVSAHTGLENEVLTQYGFKPKKRKKPQPVEKNAIRVAKARLTRVLRGTKGKRQKEALRFTGPLQVRVAPDGTSQVIDLSAPPAPPEAVAATDTAVPLAGPVAEAASQATPPDSLAVAVAGGAAPVASPEESATPPSMGGSSSSPPLAPPAASPSGGSPSDTPPVERTASVTSRPPMPPGAPPDAIV
jgi:hypothetical protein